MSKSEVAKLLYIDMVFQNHSLRHVTYLSAHWFYTYGIKFPQSGLYTWVRQF